MQRSKSWYRLFWDVSVVYAMPLLSLSMLLWRFMHVNPTQNISISVMFLDNLEVIQSLMLYYNIVPNLII